MSYAPSDLDQFRRTAVYVDNILKGAKPADLPVQEPIKFELVIISRPPRHWGAPFRVLFSLVPMI